MWTSKQVIGTIIVCLVEIAVGVLLLIDPIGFTSGIIIVVGAGLMINGIINVIKYFRMSAEDAARQQLLMQGLTSLLIGAFCVFNPNWFIVTFPMIAFIYGVVVLISGVGKIQRTVDMLRLKIKNWILSAISAVITIICAAIIIANPFATTVALWMFTGISLIVEALLEVVVLIISRSKSVNQE
ncbi:MAG: DUF308 domain-containing protein [Firmicutes bacterium]|nr:DUF308 domain-containing protein [Bacillota bacterium]